jgi:hypothetical protein
LVLYGSRSEARRWLVPYVVHIRKGDKVNGRVELTTEKTAISVGRQLVSSNHDFRTEVFHSSKGAIAGFRFDDETGEVKIEDFRVKPVEVTGCPNNIPSELWAAPTPNVVVVGSNVEYKVGLPKRYVFKSAKLSNHHSWWKITYTEDLGDHEVAVAAYSTRNDGSLAPLDEQKFECDIHTSRDQLFRSRDDAVRHSIAGAERNLEMHQKEAERNVLYLKKLNEMVDGEDPSAP